MRVGTAAGVDRGSGDGLDDRRRTDGQAGRCLRAELVPGSLLQRHVHRLGGRRRRAGVQVCGLPLREREAGLHGVELVDGARRVSGGLQDLLELLDVGSLRPDVELPEEREAPTAVTESRPSSARIASPALSVAPSSRYTRLTWDASLTLLMVRSSTRPSVPCKVTSSRRSRCSAVAVISNGFELELSPPELKATKPAADDDDRHHPRHDPFPHASVPPLLSRRWLLSLLARSPSAIWPHTATGPRC